MSAVRYNNTYNNNNRSRYNNHHQGGNRHGQLQHYEDELYTDVLPDTISIIDPENRSGKIEVPLNLTFETQGKEDWVLYQTDPLTYNRMRRNRHHAKDLSLCLLFQKFRCNAGSKCHQIHADRDYVTSIRLTVNTNAACCVRHGETDNSITSERRIRNVVLHHRDGSTEQSHADLFAHSVGLENIVGQCKGPTLYIHVGRICRLHQENRCKFGRDCKNVHMCRVPADRQQKTLIRNESAELDEHDQGLSSPDVAISPKGQSTNGRPGDDLQLHMLNLQLNAFTMNPAATPWEVPKSTNKACSDDGGSSSEDSVIDNVLQDFALRWQQTSEVEIESSDNDEEQHRVVNSSLLKELLTHPL